MDATILPFPRSQARDEAMCDLLPGIESRWTNYYLPVVNVGLELLQVNVGALEARCQRMLDGHGRALVDNLCDELERVSKEIKVVAGGLDAARTRARTAMTRLSESSL